MAYDTLTYTNTLRIIGCGECYIDFAMPESKYRRAREEGEDWYCPNGHCRVFRENELSTLRKEKRQLQERLDQQHRRTSEVIEQRDQVKSQLRATKAAHTRTKKRIHNGVCPHCNRHFANVERHMENQHPDKVTEG